MRKLALAIGFTLLVAPFAAAQHASKNDATAMVKKAAAFVKANGREKSLAAFNDPKGPFVKGELYVFVLDSTGVALAHGTNQKFVGKNWQSMKDVDGKLFQQEFLSVAKAGGGWVDYKMTNPVTRQVEAKTTYVERVEDLTIGCGIYK